MKTKKTNNPLTKCAVFSDIHFGKKSNSKTHNRDCINFLVWFCERVKEDSEIDHIIFLGDWNENRSALNIETLKYSYIGAKLINNLGLPVFFVVGNHDLYHRHTREVHSVLPFNEFKNFVVIDEPTIVEGIGNTGALFCPFLFHKEYPSLTKFLNYETWWGHFEFRGFMISGYAGVVMHNGPDLRDFKGPKHIVSGHFHKRQQMSQVTYIGNTFPMDFGDAGDYKRGMMKYDHKKDKMVFIDWKDCPKYINTTLSNILENNITLIPKMSVKCTVDVPITFEESYKIREVLIKKYNLRDFTLEESSKINEAMTETEVSVEWDEVRGTGVNDLVLQMLNEIDSEHINNQTLINIYQKI